MIDTHCHLDAAPFDTDRALVLDRAWAAGLSGLLIPATTPDRWEALLECAGRDSRVQVALGVHPRVLRTMHPDHDEAVLARLDSLLRSRVAVAVGECGLDGPSAPAVSLDRQVAMLRGHLDLARRHGLPLVVHCVRAHPPLMALLRTETGPERGVLLHSYSGSADLTSFYLEHGCSFSFAGALTFPGARRPLEALRVVPLERLMLETDAPDQTPYPHRGERNEPALLPLILTAVARARGAPPSAIQAAVSQNARRFFGAWSIEPGS